MKVLLAAVLMVGFSASASSLSDSVGADEIILSSLREASNGPVKTLTGEVRIQTPSVIIRADQATFHADTHEIELAGHVHISLK